MSRRPFDHYGAAALGLALSTTGCAPAAARAGTGAEMSPGAAGSCERGVAIQPLGERVGPAPAGGRCAELLEAAGAHYLIDRLGEASSVHRIVRRGQPEFALQFAGVASLVAATHARRSELVLAGAYSSRFSALSATDPESGYFLLKLDARGNVLWKRTSAAAEVTSDRGPRALALAEDESVVVAGPEDLAFRSLVGSPAAAGAPGWALARLDGSGQALAYETFAGDYPQLLLAGAERSVVYLAMEVDRGQRLVRLEERNRIAWERRLSAFALGAIAGAPDGGVWFAVQSHSTRADRRHVDSHLLHFDASGTARERFAIGDAPGAPAGHQRLDDLAIDSRGRLWLLGTFENSVAVGDCTLEAAGFGRESFVSVLERTGRPLLLASVSRSVSELAPALALHGNDGLLARYDSGVEAPCELDLIKGPNATGSRE